MDLLKPLFIIACYLISLSFFDLVFFPDQLIPMLEFGLFPLIFLFLLILIVYQKGEVIKSNFKVEVYIVLFTVLLSMFGAYYFHGQSYKTTALAQRAMYLYFFYFLLLRLKPKPALLLKIIVFTGVFVAIIYILQTIVYPTELVRSPKRFDRGTLRIFMPGVGYAVLAYFYFFNQYLKHLRVRDIFFVVILFTIFILMGTRQLILPVIMVTVLNLILTKRIRSKITVAFLGILAAIPLFFLFQDIFIQIFELTKSQGSNIEADIRFKAINFFINDFFPNPASHFTGNGVPGGTSDYAAKIEYYMTEFGFFQSDVGIIGEYTRFGIFFVIINVVILVKLVIIKVPEDYKFLWYSNLINIINMFLGALMSIPDGIILLCTMLYLYDVSKYKENILSE